MSSLKDFLERQIGAGGALGLLALLAMIYFSARGVGAEQALDLAWVAFYALIPLAMTKLVGVEDLLDDLREIKNRSGIPPRERVTMMREALEIEVREWWTVWRKLKTGDRGAARRVADAFLGLAKGSITALEAVFIAAYFLYRAVFRPAVYSLSPPADVVVQVVAALAVFLLNSRRKVGKVLGKMWEILWADVDDFEGVLRRIEHLIKVTCHRIYLADEKAREGSGSPGSGVELGSPD